MALSLDGHAVGVQSSGTTNNSLVITNGTNNALVFVVAVANSGHVTGISESPSQSLTWRLVATSTASNNFPIEVWWAKVPTAFSGATLTVTWGAVTGFNMVLGIAIAGQDQTSTFSWQDGSPGFTTNDGNGTAAANLTYTSTNANVAVVAASRFAGTGAATAGSGWTLTDSVSFSAIEYQLPPNTAGTVFTATYTTGAGDTDGNVMFGIVAPSAAPAATIADAATLSAITTDVYAIGF